MKEYPIGTLTFLLTDIESSTDLWDRYPEAMRFAMARHDEIIEGIVDAAEVDLALAEIDASDAVIGLGKISSWFR